MARDPYKYFRIEARELVEKLSAGVLKLEGVADAAMLAEALRWAHTLKGAARTVKKKDIADLAHQVEDALAAARDQGRGLDRDTIHHVLKAMDAIGVLVSALGQAAASPVASAVISPVATQREAVETVRVELAEMDDLLERVSEVRVQLGVLRPGISAVEAAIKVASELADDNASATETAKHQASAAALRLKLEHAERSLTEGARRIGRELDRVRERADRLRLVPASTVVNSLERAVRDAAESQRKAVKFVAKVGDSRLDGHVLAALQDALMHVVRNAVAHGIEPEAERLAAGKSATGRVELKVERIGNRVTFTCRDDGRGIDVAAVGRASVSRGLLTPSQAEALNLEGAISVLLNGGVSSAAEVTDVSGRGVGLNVLREVTSNLKGELNVQSQPGRGTTIEVSVPVSLSSMPALLVEVDHAVVAVPLTAVLKTARITEPNVVRSSQGSSVLHEGKAIPMVSLAQLLRRSAAPNRGQKAWTAVILHANSTTVALVVDRLLRIGHVVVRKLPALAGQVRGVAGASFDADGTPQLVLEPNGLVAAVQTESGLQPSAPEEQKRQPILIIDDSMTTRMLEQGILEMAGYEVDLAVCAEEGLEKARTRNYGLFLVDVEMPGMNGFEFVALTRADQTLKQVPAILVTTLGTPEDKRRGAEAGAYSYIVKGEFDEERFLETVRQVVG